MRVEQERRNAERKDGDPEVNDPWRPNRQSHVEQHDERAHAEVDTRACETRVQDGERDTRRRETTPSSNVPCTTEGQVRDDGVGRDLGGEDLERRRQRAEVFGETNESLRRTTLNEFCLNDVS